MKNSILIHKNYDLSKMYLKYFIALIPLIIYGFYKNGLLLYLDEGTTFLGMFKPILIPFLGFVGGILVNYIFNKKIDISKYSLYGVLVAMMMPISTNIILFFVSVVLLQIVSNYLETKISFNSICFTKLIIILLLLLFNLHEYANSIEVSNEYAFSFIDIIFGRTVSGISTSSIIWIIISFIYLSLDYYYKKEIPIYAISTYMVVTLISWLFLKDHNIIINNILSPNNLFAFIFVAPISMYSSYTKKGKVLFGILIGFLTALFINIFSMEAAVIAILLVSLVKDLCDKKIQNKLFTR